MHQTGLGQRSKNSKKRLRPNGIGLPLGMSNPVIVWLWFFCTRAKRPCRFFRAAFHGCLADAERNCCNRFGVAEGSVNMSLQMLMVFAFFTAVLGGLGLYVGANRAPEPPDSVEKLERELAELRQRVNLIEAATVEQIREPK